MCILAKSGLLENPSDFCFKPIIQDNVAWPVLTQEEGWEYTEQLGTLFPQTNKTEKHYYVLLRRGEQILNMMKAFYSL